MSRFWLGLKRRSHAVGRPRFIGQRKNPIALWLQTDRLPRLNPFVSTGLYFQSGDRLVVALQLNLDAQVRPESLDVPHRTEQRRAVARRHQRHVIGPDEELSRPARRALRVER